jgi:ABC-2 type transport system ATP-binding protein
MYAIQTVALNKRFHRVHAVRDVNLSVDKGAVYALMGPNGAGKTTLIKLLMNLMSPTDGRIDMLGEGAFKLEGKNLEKVGYVSENQKLPGWMSVGKFLAYCRPFYPTWDQSLEKRLVERFELPLNRRLKHLSRGQRMKASLCSALAFHPKLLILDEPLSGLDPLVRDDLMESLTELAAETTVLLSSHDLAEIESYASHVGYMDDGRLLLSESMGRVQMRFKKVVATIQGLTQAPVLRPIKWIDFKSEGKTASWIETDYDAELSPAKAHEVFGPVELTVESMTLREVFLAMARTRQRAETGGKLQ